MYPIHKKKVIVGVFAMTLTALACGPLDLAREMLGRLPTITPELEAVTVIEADTTMEDWYVATDGDNTNSCATPEAPCLTLAGAAGKASSLDRIHVAAGVYLGTDGLGERLPTLFDKNLSIIGEGSGVTIFDANNAGGGMKVYGTSDVQMQGFTIQNTQGGPAAGCIHTSLTANLTAEDLILQNCWQSGLRHDGSGLVHLINVIISDAFDDNPDPGLLDRGYGISNSGELVVEGGEIRNSENHGITNNGPLLVSGTLIRNNQTEGVVNYYAGSSTFSGVTISNNGVALLRDGVSIQAGDVSITDSTISANGKRAIFQRGPSVLRMNTSTISDHPNTALSIRSNAIAELDEVTISNNSAASDSGPVIYNAGNLTMRKSHIINNFQQALYNTDEAIAFIYDSEFSGNRSLLETIFNNENSEMLIARSLIANNTVSEPFRAALRSDGVMELENTTISNNNQQGIYMNGETILSYITVAENGGFGILASGSGPFVIANILVARNLGGDCEGFFTLPNVSMLPSSTIREYNIDTDGTCGFQETHSPGDIRLGGLADNGGLTFTHALLHDPDSPAIDAATGVCPATDQREYSRAGLCDVGAYETNAVALSLDDTDIVIGTPTPDGPSTVTITTTTHCYAGPGTQYGQISSLREGVVAQLIGAGFTGNGNQDWVVASHPTAANTNCWLDTDDVVPSIPFSEMRLITVPGLPTPTPQPTSDRPAPEDTPIPCYYDQNNALICP